MDDEAILTLYRQRDSSAVAETEAKYGRLCFSVAHNILFNREDSEECVNDTWLHAWNAIPPEWPLRFSAWLTRVTRNLAISRLRESRAQKRGGEPSRKNCGKLSTAFWTGLILQPVMCLWPATSMRPPTVS